jgi:hypothetical protein
MASGSRESLRWAPAGWRHRPHRGSVSSVTAAPTGR